MGDKRLKGEIRQALSQIETQCGDSPVFSVNDNGNIVLSCWTPGPNERQTLTALVDLADQYGLGVLATRSAYQASTANMRTLAEFGFKAHGPSITQVATGKQAPPNYCTFTRSPAGAPLFSHHMEAAQREKGIHCRSHNGLHC